MNDGVQTAKKKNLGDAVSGQIFVFRTYPTPAPRSSHHRPQKKSTPVHTRTSTALNVNTPPPHTAGREGGSKGITASWRIQCRQHHGKATSRRTDSWPCREKFNGLLLVTLAEKKQPLPTSVLMSDSPEKTTGVSFPTRCSTQLAEVYSYSGRCPSPWFRSFLCPQSS